jgi:hypothetical protein
VNYALKSAIVALKNVISMQWKEWNIVVSVQKHAADVLMHVWLWLMHKQAN